MDAQAYRRHDERRKDQHGSHQRRPGPHGAVRRVQSRSDLVRTSPTRPSRSHGDRRGRQRRLVQDRLHLVHRPPQAVEPDH